MDFEFSHSFDASTDELAEALLDEKFQASLSDIGSLAEREVIGQHHRQDGTVVREIRCVLDIEVTGVAQKLLGAQKPAWVEEAEWDPDELKWLWSINPEVAAELLSASGEIRIEEEDDEAVRVVTGTVKVKVPLYGGKVEGWIVNGLEAAYDEEADRLTEWLERKL